MSWPSVRRVLMAADRRIGYRGTFLSFFALLDCLYALSLLEPQPEVLRSPTTIYIASIMPLPAWGLLWLAVGIILWIGTFAEADRWAFAAAAALKTLWGATFLFGWLFFHLDRGWISAVIWLVLAAVVLRISGWPEPRHHNH